MSSEASNAPHTSNAQAEAALELLRQEHKLRQEANDFSAGLQQALEAAKERERAALAMASAEASSDQVATPGTTRNTLPQNKSSAFTPSKILQKGRINDEPKPQTPSMASRIITNTNT